MYSFNASKKAVLDRFEEVVRNEQKPDPREVLETQVWNNGYPDSDRRRPDGYAKQSRRAVATFARENETTARKDSEAEIISKSSLCDKLSGGKT